MGSCTSKNKTNNKHDNMDDTYYRANQDNITNDEMSYQEPHEMIGSMNKISNN